MPYFIDILKISDAEKLQVWNHYLIWLYMHTKNDSHMMYSSWDIKWDGQNFLSFWTIFFPFTPLTTWKINNHIEKWQSYDVWFLRYGAWWTDGRTDGQMDRQKKWHIEVDAPPKNVSFSRFVFLWNQQISKSVMTS